MQKFYGLLGVVLVSSVILTGCASVEETTREAPAAVGDAQDESEVSVEEKETDSNAPVTQIETESKEQVEVVESGPEPTVEDTYEGEDEQSVHDPLKIGYLLPLSGPLGFIGESMVSGVELATSEINAAGGVLGLDVDLLAADEVGEAKRAKEEAGRLLSSGVKSIIGAAASGMTLAVIDDITRAGVVQCSPSNTAIPLDTYPDNGYYFRTAPSDALQAVVVAELIAEAGHQTVSIAARDDEYGLTLSEATSNVLASLGIEVLAEEIYDTETESFESVSEALVDSQAEAYVMMSFLEGAQIIQGLFDLGVEGSKIFGFDGLAGSAFSDNFSAPADLEGFTAVAPTANVPESFENRLLEFRPGLEEVLFSPNAYDCVNLIALAAEVSGSTASESIRDNMIRVTTGQNACNTFVECRAFIDAGESISYQSAVGVPLHFNEVRQGGGDPSRSYIQVYQWQGGEIVSKEVRVSDATKF